MATKKYTDDDLMNLDESGSDFSYENASASANRYQNQIDDWTDRILNRESFTYDPDTDPTYQQYEKSYTRGGQRAMQDTLGQVSSRTGGLASSFATTAAQQSYDNYMAELADKVPELRQAAYDMYLAEGDEMRNNLNMLLSLQNGEYDKYLNQQNYNYQLDRDAISDQRYNDETAYNRNLQKAQTLASAGDYSGYKALGFTDDEVSTLQTAAQEAARAAMQQGSVTGSGNGYDYTLSDDYDSLFLEAYKQKSPKNYINGNFKKYGFQTKDGLYDAYEEFAGVMEEVKEKAKAEGVDAAAAYIDELDEDKYSGELKEFMLDAAMEYEGGLAPAYATPESDPAPEPQPDIVPDSWFRYLF